MSREDIEVACIGGLLIGLATSLHYIVKGRITGFSGIYYSLITYDENSFFWKLALMSAVAFSSSLFYIKYGQSPIISGAGPAFDSVNAIASIGYVPAAIAGFLVGFGTKLGNGCTSGHGVCGLPRLSKRSFVAVCCFMGFGMLTATFKEQIYQEELLRVLPFQTKDVSQIVAIVTGILILIGIGGQLYKNKYSLNDALIATLVGLIFGSGLVVSGMVRRTKIIGFLTLNSHWDPSLLFVMLVAVGLNFITFRLVNKPLLNDSFEAPKLSVIDLKLVLGSSLFGIGWGIGGLCPGPAIALFPEFTVEIGVVFLLTLAVGQVIAQQVSQSI